MTDLTMILVKFGAASAFLIASVFAWHFGHKFVTRLINRGRGDKPRSAMTWRDGISLALGIALYALAFLAFLRGVSWGTQFVLDAFDNPGSKGAVAIRIGGQSLAVPRAFLEIRRRKLAGDIERLTLELLLPDLSPNVGPFGRSREGSRDDRARIVRVSMSPHLPGTDLLRGFEQERFREAKGSATTYGLVQFKREAGRSPAGERLYHYDFGRWRTLELRCGAHRYKSPDVCAARYSGYARFELQYEFADNRLAEWRRIHDAVVKTVDGFLPNQDDSTRR